VTSKTMYMNVGRVRCGHVPSFSRDRMWRRPSECVVLSTPTAIIHNSRYAKRTSSAKQRSCAVCCSPAVCDKVQEMCANAHETRDSSSVISYAGCLGLYPVIWAKTHSKCASQPATAKNSLKTHIFGVQGS